jgi:hypothetical protein
VKIGHTGEMSTPAAPLETTVPVEEQVTNPVTDEGDHDRFAHYVRKTDATRAAVDGTPVVALCGKVWVPSRDPQKYPVCKTCAEIRAQIVARGNN